MSATKAKPLWETGERELMIKSAVETALPPLLLLEASRVVVIAGYRLRSDIQSKLDAGAGAALASLARDPSAISEAATRTDEAARRLLNDLGVSDPVHSMYVAACFALRLVEEHLLADDTNPGVLTAMLLMLDLKEHGFAEDYIMRERVLVAEADRLIVRAKKLGLYDSGPSQQAQALSS